MEKYLFFVAGLICGLIVDFYRNIYLMGFNNCMSAMRQQSMIKGKQENEKH